MKEGIDHTGAFPPQIAELHRSLINMGARPHHVMSDGGVLSDGEEWTSRGVGSRLARTHYFIGKVLL